MLKLEIWKNIRGYEGLYRVSSYGNVKRLRFTNNHCDFPQERMMKKSLKSNGYEIVRLSKKGIKTTKMVHRLVAMAFLKNPNNYKEVNHIDGNKTNNIIDNLEWCNRSQNELHAWKIGLKIVTPRMKEALEKINERKKEIKC